jgi:hypothetical protein
VSTLEEKGRVSKKEEGQTKGILEALFIIGFKLTIGSVYGVKVLYLFSQTAFPSCAGLRAKVQLFLEFK